VPRGISLFLCAHLGGQVSAFLQEKKNNSRKACLPQAGRKGAKKGWKAGFARRKKECPPRRTGKEMSF